MAGIPDDGAVGIQPDRLRRLMRHAERLRKLLDEVARIDDIHLDVTRRMFLAQSAEPVVNVSFDAPADWAARAEFQEQESLRRDVLRGVFPIRHRIEQNRLFHSD